MSVSKQELREEIRARLKTLTDVQRSALSSKACALLEKQNVWKNAKSVFFYAPLPEEIDIWPLVRDSLGAGKLVCLPRFDAATNRYVACQIQNLAGDVISGRFGIREPISQCPTIPLSKLDLALVPGVAFDLRCRRLGRGKGFYDRLLADASGVRCGVAFDEQIVAEIPVEPHDVSVDCLLTPTRWLEF